MTAATPIRGVLFDKDGTLFTFAATWTGAAHACLRRLAPDDPALRRALGAAVGFDVVTGAFAPGSPAVAGSIDQMAALWAPLLPGWSEAALIAAILQSGDDDATPAPAAADLPGLLAGLRAAGLTLGVATHDGEASARAQLAQARALDAFAFVAGFDSGHGLKPGPGMPRAFAAQTGLDPRAVVMVGDSVHDLAAGRAAGGWAVGVLTGPAVRADLDPLAHAVLDSIEALPGWLAPRLG